MDENDGPEQIQNEAEPRGIVDRAKDAIGSARQQVSHSVDVMTGADIRRFDEFTDATTRAVVGVHQDLTELRQQVARTQGLVDDVQEGQKRLNERVDEFTDATTRAVVGVRQDLAELRQQVARTQGLVDDIQEGQKRLNERLDEQEQLVGRHANLTLRIAAAGALTVALLLSIAALVLGI